MRTITLTQGKVALVDDADFDRVNAHKWHAMKIDRRFYAVRNIPTPNGKQTRQYMHQFLLPGVPRIDHRDGDSLNNQKESNLRPATRQQNGRGFRHKAVNKTSQFRGVSWYKQRSKWIAQISVDGKNIYLGLFKIEEDAARARDAATRKYYGEFAHLNFP